MLATHDRQHHLTFEQDHHCHIYPATLEVTLSLEYGSSNDEPVGTKMSRFLREKKDKFEIINH